MIGAKRPGYDDHFGKKSSCGLEKPTPRPRRCKEENETGEEILALGAAFGGENPYLYQITRAPKTPVSPASFWPDP
jgi:hypothetical protein